MRHLIRGASALALSTALLGSAALAQDDGDSVTLYRVFVGDHKDPKVTAFDLSKPEKRWTFDTVGQNKLYSVNEGASVSLRLFHKEVGDRYQLIIAYDINEKACETGCSLLALCVTERMRSTLWVPVFERYQNLGLS